MTDRTIQSKCKELVDALAQKRELEKRIEALKAQLDAETGKKDAVYGPYVVKYVDRVEDYIRGKNATALKEELPEVFAQYGGATSVSRTPRISRTN